MQCPYCRHPLEPLVIQGRASGAWQCIRCGGAWLQYQQLGGLLGSGPTPLYGVGLLGSGPSTASPAPDDSPSAPGRSPWQPLGMPADFGTSPWQTGAEASWGTGGVAGQAGRLGQAGAFQTGAGATPRSERGGQGASTRRPWWPWSKQEAAPPGNPDWDLCTYCGQLHPGAGPNCAHCNIERMRCPQCLGLMIGVRRQAVLVDMCLSCQGLFFERGRLEALLERLRGGGEVLAEGERPSSPPSLLQQLAAFLEDTEPDPYSTGNRPTSVVGQVAAAFSAGLGGGRQILYDFLVLLGDMQTPDDGKSRKPPGSSGR